MMCHHCSIHYGSSLVAQGIRKWRCVSKNNSNLTLSEVDGTASLHFSVWIAGFVATSGPTIWTSAYGLEPGLYNRLLIELSGWAQTVHMFTQRFT